MSAPYIVKALANDKLLFGMPVNDPLIRISIQLKGWRWALKVLFGGVTVEVKVEHNDA